MNVFQIMEALETKGYSLEESFTIISKIVKELLHEKEIVTFDDVAEHLNLKIDCP